ncbi:MAG: NAD(P)/FAD-dependent oxidoreductase [Alphaproteobacteria bacterium]
MSERRQTEVAVVGAGIVGCSAALHLRRRNVPVVVLDKDFVGAQASGVNFGGVRQQGRDLAELPLARRARGMWERLEEVVGTDCEFRVTGHLKLAQTEEELAELERYAEQTKAYGLELEVLDRKALKHCFPWFGDAVAGASWCAEDGQADPRLAGPAFGRAARAAGAEIREGAEVTELDRDADGFTLLTRNGLEVRARRLVNTAGAWAGGIAARFGEPVPVEATAPQMAVSEPGPYFIGPVLGISGGAIYLRQTLRGNVIFGGGLGLADAEASRSYVLPENTLAVTRLAVTLIPRLRSLHIIRVWTGLEGSMPDGLPVIGPSRTTPGLYHAFGFSGHGFQLGPAVGAVLAELIVDGATDTPMGAFDIARFARPSGGAGKG